jgi:2'-5' RNA ligase
MSEYTLQQKSTVQQLKNRLEQGSGNLTVVEMRADYENDIEICLSSVVFAPDDLTQSISKRILEPLKSIEPEHFYYTSDLMHSTIKNVRTINNPPLFDEDDVAKAHQVFEQIIPQFPSFTLNWEDLTLFPTSVALIGYCNQTLQQLIQALDTGLTEIGIPDNKTYFSNTIFWGNLTVCRLRHPPGAAFRQRVKELETIQLGEMPVTHIHLVTCNAVCHPKTRKIIGTYPLR